MKILIIGNSAASTAAVESIRKYDEKSTITMLTDEPHPLYSRCLISYYLAGTIEELGLSYREKDFHKKMNVELNLGRRAIEVDPIRKNVKCDNGKTFDFDKLLIATGASSKIPTNMPANVNGIFVLRSLTDAKDIKKKIPNAKNAVILGGGLIGMRAASALAKCGLKVTVIIRSNRILSQMIDDKASQIINSRLSENNISVKTNTDIQDIITKDNKLVAIKTDKGEEQDCDLCVVAKGVTANTQLIQNTDIKKNWGIVTNPYMQTNHENIFASGDVAETFDITTEDYTINALWTMAVQQGRIAGLNIIEKQTAYDGSLGMNSLNLFNVPLISFGVISPKDESKYKILLDDRHEQGIYKKIVISKNCIKGIILIGKIDNAGVLLSLIRNKIDVSKFSEELLSDQFDFGKYLKYTGKKGLEMYYT